jgi:hypothetical protein
MNVRHGLQKNRKSRQGCNERLPRKKKMNEKKACKQASCWYGVSRGRAGLLSMLGIVPGVAGLTVLNLYARILLLAYHSPGMFKTESRLVAPRPRTWMGY